MKSFKKIGVALILSMGLVQQGNGTVGASPSGNTIGIGVNSLSYWDGSYAMADLQRHATYQTRTWGVVPVDADGWPTTDALVFLSSVAMAPGVYHIEFTGSITSFNGSLVTKITNRVYHPTTNKTTADLTLTTLLTGNQWISLVGTRRLPSDPINTGFTDLHIWRPGIPTDGSVMFTPEFITAMQKFKVLRTMDMIDANLNMTASWSERSLMRWAGSMHNKAPWIELYNGPEYFSGTMPPVGMPWELMVQMANAANTDLWINVPVRANDAYITKLAQLIRYGSDGVEPYTTDAANPVWPGLNPNLKVYVEYGNETWNTSPGFYGFYATKELAKSVMNDLNHPINHLGTTTDVNTARMRYHAWRSSVISLKFRDVFGDADMMTWVRPILSTQGGNTLGGAGNASNILGSQLLWADSFYHSVRTNNPVVRRVNEIWYGGGGAAYYDSTISPKSSDPIPPNDPTVMATFFANLPNAVFASNNAGDSTWTKAYGLQRVAYEGGPGPGGDSVTGKPGMNSAEIRVYNADPRMINSMLAAQDIWTATGGDLLVYYTYQSARPWEFSTGSAGVADTDTVKLQAIDMINASPTVAIALGASVPGVVQILNSPYPAIPNRPGAYKDATKGTRATLMSRVLDPATGQPDPTQATALMAPVRAAIGGTYTLQLDALAYLGATVEILVNGVAVGTVNVPPPPLGASTIMPSSTISANLPEGLSVLMLRALNKDTSVRDIVVTHP